MVDRTDVGRLIGGVHPRGPIAARAQHPDSVLPHGREVRSTGDEMDFGACSIERGSDIGADRSGADDCDFHRGALRSL